MCSASPPSGLASMARVNRRRLGMKRTSERCSSAMGVSLVIQFDDGLRPGSAEGAVELDSVRQEDPLRLDQRPLEVGEISQRGQDREIVGKPLFEEVPRL